MNLSKIDLFNVNEISEWWWSCKLQSGELLVFGLQSEQLISQRLRVLNLVLGGF